MRYLMMTTETGDTGEWNPEQAAAMGAFIEELTRSGALLATGGLDPHPKRIASKDGKVTVTDGPFAEAKEQVVGFALIDVRTEEEAVELSRRFWAVAGDGAGVIHRVFSPGDDMPTG
ncbi:YciI family protein [Actinomadura flavalba]|uniref:YciI family protein n=1 Tax=Actinomadura flavalba TaxID=1120938 RepID=UPI000378EF2E|nr:YciI family protein [Actinomadura flavalba]